jgi:hypothetical protein
MAAYIYPLESLGDFRLWLQNEYIPNKFPSYLSSKIKKGAFPASRKEAILKTLTPLLPRQINSARGDGSRKMIDEAS